MVSLLLVPPPDVTVSLNRSGPLFAGTGLTISCIVSLDPSVNNNERVSTDWTGLENISSERYTITPAMRASDNMYTGTLTLSPLADQDTGTIIICTGRVTGDTEKQRASSSGDVYINVTGRSSIWVHCVSTDLSLLRPARSCGDHT